MITSQKRLSFLQFFLANWMEREKLLIFQEECVQKGVPWWSRGSDICGPYSIPGLGTEIPHQSSANHRQKTRKRKYPKMNTWEKTPLSKYRIDGFRLNDKVLRF